MSFDLYRASQSESVQAFRSARNSTDLPFRIKSRVGPAARVAARRPDGSLVTLGDLPDPASRWTLPRKRVVVECVDFGLLAFEAAASRYRLTEEELGEWRRTVHARGRAPLLWPERPVRISGGRVSAGSAEIDLDSRRLHLAGESVPLSESEMTVLATVAEAGGGIVSNAMLMAELYGSRDVAAGSKIVDVLVCRLRRKLGMEAGRFRSVWGRGHFLVL
jgi:hypothetical protein